MTAEACARKTLRGGIMRRWLVGLVLCLGALTGPDAHACGDKFLVIGRGVRRIPRAALVRACVGHRLPL